jgi:hypothetical protein
MKNKKWLIALGLILCFGLLIRNCVCNRESRKFSAEEYEIARSVFENDKEFASEVMEKNVPSAASSDPHYGQRISWKYATGKITPKYAKPDEVKDPIYIEFDKEDMALISSLKDKMESQAIIRAYLGNEWDYDDNTGSTSLVRTLVFVETKYAGECAGISIYDDDYNNNVAYNVGSACPPDCIRGMPQIINGVAVGGASMAREAYTGNSARLLPPELTTQRNCR